MQKTQIVYKGNKPTDKEVAELMELMPNIEITWTRFKDEDIKTVIDPIYNIRTVDWDWFRTFFTKGNAINCFVFEPRDLNGVGVNQHWGFYSLDEDLDHHFYMTNLGKRLEPRAKANGFESNFVWMFVHEYLHGAVWGNTRNRNLAAALVHEWERQGILKAELKKDLVKYNVLITTKTLLETIIDLYKRIIANNNPTGLKPRVERATEAVISEMKKKGHQVRLVQGFRSKAEQDKLYAQGRTSSGAVVTNAKAGESLHNYGVAVDFVFVQEGYNASSLLWETLGEVGTRQGFEWGGDWTSLVDKPHFEMKLGYTLKDFQNGKVDYTKFN